MRMKPSIPLLPFALALLASGGVSAPLHLAQASQYFGRLTTGSYVANEHFKVESDGMSDNSFATISSRVYLRVYDISAKKFEWITDFRDKNDFFDTLDAPGLKLTPKNTAQLRQLSLRNADESDRYFVELGRFAVPDTGAVKVDGGSVGVRWNRQVSTALFGGLNPQRSDQATMTYNRDSFAYGANFVYQPRSSDWKRAFYVSNAFVQETVASHIDRRFLYSNLFYQWGTNSQIFGLVYLDFVPRVYAQTGLINYVQRIAPTWTSNLNLTSVNALEYSRTQGVLEQLEPSGFREGGLSLQNTLSPNMKMNYSGRYGTRTADQLSRVEGSAGPTFNRIFSKYFNLATALGYRKDFTNHTTFLKSRLGFYPLNWEGDFDLNIGSKMQSSGVTTHPIIVEASIARYFSKVMYASFTMQEAHEESVNILSFFVKLGYRFGSEDVAPLKDGAPPPGGRP